MSRLRVSIVGGSGYVGGEVLRLLLAHPMVDVAQVTSERHAGASVTTVHPNLRKLTDLSFEPAASLRPCDALCLCLPHGRTMLQIDSFLDVAPRLIDLSADFRFRDPAQYVEWYGAPHPRPDLLEQFVYGIPELSRDAMRTARWISSAGCNATAAILALAPLYRRQLVEIDRTVIEAKVGSSEGGATASAASHHPERSGCVRSYKPTGHRHAAEMAQAFQSPVRPYFSATAVELVRGVLVTCHVFLTEDLPEKAIWRVYREAYRDEPFVRIVKAADGVYRYPEPKILAGSNFCDIGFERDPGTRRLVVIAALDNLMKGAAGQAVQALNLMHGWDETAGLGFSGLHPA